MRENRALAWYRAAVSSLSAPLDSTGSYEKALKTHRILYAQLQTAKRHHLKPAGEHFGAFSTMGQNKLQLETEK